MLLRLVFICFFACTLAPSGFAATAIPSKKPTIEAMPGFQNAEEYAHFRRAMRALDNKKWDEARSYAAGVSYIAAKDLILWRLAIEDKDIPFFELKQAVETLEGWPRFARIRSNAEKLISDSGLTEQNIVKYFDKWLPVSGEGRVAYAKALKAINQDNEAKSVLKQAWTTNWLPPETEKEARTLYEDLFSEADYAARADAMIWSRNRSSVRRVLPYLHGDNRVLMNARYKFMSGGRNLDSVMRKVPERLQQDPGLIYERARWRRRRGLTEGATELALHFPQGHRNSLAARKIWLERHLLARQAIKDGDFKTAYALAAGHGMTKGGAFADGEWLSGWLALQKLNDPILAASHFTRLRDGVTRPVSLARAYYWLGRAQIAMNDTELATGSWQKAARFDFTYYGQLAAEALGQPMLNLGKDPQPTAEQRTNFSNNILVQALKLIGRQGDNHLFRTFSYYLDDILPNATDHVMLARLARDMGQPRPALRAAKAALWRGEVLPDSTWPVLVLPEHTLVEPALILALSRQESEMDPRAVSSVGAYGLMQLMPTTARHTARLVKKPYNKYRLLDDPDYNMALGSRHLRDLIDYYDGSYILSIAAYNAGKHRINRWIESYGDPRKDANPVDWVESIPFTETRNYVQRVMENIQVYRQRLAGKPFALNIGYDLARGRMSASQITQAAEDSQP